ncbi:MAG: UvrB/UvrC motif-containing protein [bacterium]
MNCERCGKRPGSVRYTEVTGGQARKQLVCAECAQELGFETPSPATEAPEAGEAPALPPPAKIFGVVSIDETLKAAEDAAAEPEDARRCPECGLTAAAFRTQSLFGCPRCYEAFEEGLDLLLKRLHGAVTHRGRLPRGNALAAEAEPGALRRELDDAIQRQDFQRAAYLRDRLRERERSGGGPRDLAGEGGAP